MRFATTICICLFILFKASIAQYAPDYSVIVKDQANIEMKFAWAGGLNNPQFSEIDLNNDGLLDLFIFDRTGNKVLTFLNGGTPNSTDYSYAPQYESHFPSMESWALLTDFNCDNIADIFTYTNFPATGIKVFKGFYDSANSIQFSLEDSLLEYPFSGHDVNLYVSSIDIPAIVDVNGDGDKDILTFQQTGGFVMYFENLSIESGDGCSALIFEKRDDCWGDFFESGLKHADDLNQPCPFLKPSPKNEDKFKGSRHSGSTLLSFDNDGDGDLELITGDVSFNNLVYLTNGGDPNDAHIVDQDTTFPAYDVPTDIYVFPAAFRADVDNDGLKDILVSPNWQQGAENYYCSWYYKNFGTPVTGEFQYQTNRFMVQDMVDVGEGSTPVFLDVDSDGLLDMLIGNYGYFDGTSSLLYVSKLSYYHNVGDAEHPSFQLENTDFAEISSLGVLYAFPTFGDLDGDADMDMLTGRDDGSLLYFKNIAESGSPANFVFMSPNYAGIDVGNFSTPQLVDVNRDGLTDLLIGERDGNINYFKNTGTQSNPVFTLINSFFGSVDVRQPGYLTGYSVPYLTELASGDSYTLLVGCERGFIFQYTDIDGNLDSAFTKVDSTYSDIFVGSRATITGADADGDGKKEFLVGNYRGGVTYFDQSTSIGIPVVPAIGALNVYPNPASDRLVVDFPESLLNTNCEMAMVNMLGEKILVKQLNTGAMRLEIALAGVPSGVYFLRLSNENNSFVGKVIVSR